MSLSTDRRHFLKSAVAASSAPFVLPSSVWGAETKPSERLTMGFIGMGKQNRGLLRGFMGRSTTEVVAVCDVDTTRRERALQMVNERYASQGSLRGGRAAKVTTTFASCLSVVTSTRSALRRRIIGMPSSPLQRWTQAKMSTARSRSLTTSTSPRR